MSTEAVWPWNRTRGYQYFDTPDGQDTLKKLWAATKTSGAIAVGLATFDALILTPPSGYLQGLSRFAYVCTPVLGMSTAFVMCKNVSCSVRGKDDKLNWAVGAIAAGGIYGAWRKSVSAGFTACMLFTGLALLKKHALQNNWDLIEYDVKQQQGSLRSVRQDFTLTQHRPGNWTTGKE